MEEQKTQKPEKKLKSNDIFIFLVIAIVIFVGVLLAYLLQGKTTITGEFPTPETATSLICENHLSPYPFFVLDKSTSRKTKINAIFDNSENLVSVSLIYNLYFSDVESMSGSKSFNIAEMYKNFAMDGLEAGAFNTNFNTSETDLTTYMSLYAKSSELSPSTVKYFLLNGVSFPINYSSAKSTLETNAFSCK